MSISITELGILYLRLGRDVECIILAAEAYGLFVPGEAVVEDAM
jgi:hypothetical protein